MLNGEARWAPSEAPEPVWKGYTVAKFTPSRLRRRDLAYGSSNRRRLHQSLGETAAYGGIEDLLDTVAENGVHLLLLGVHLLLLGIDFLLPGVHARLLFVDFLLL